MSLKPCASCLLGTVLIFVGCGDDQSADPDSGSADSGVVDSRSDAGGPVDNLGVLRALGVDVETGARTSHIDGEPLSDDAHPLPAVQTPLAQIDELYGVGFEYRPSYGHRYFLLDDPADTAPNLVSPTGDETWTEAHRYHKQKAAVGADIDGDGFDEVVTAYTIIREEGGNYIAEEVKLRVMQDAAEGFAESTHSPLESLGDLGASTECTFWDTCLDLVAGDLDGDGDDELVLVTNFEATLYVLDLDGDTLGLSALKRYPSAPQALHVMVDAADLDGDGKAEIAAAISDLDGDAAGLASYAIYRYDDGSLEESASDFLVNAGTQIEYLVNVVAGDFDGDRLNELAFGGRNVTAGYSRLLLMEDGRGVSPAGSVEPYTILDTAPAINGWNVGIEAGDFDGDQADELVVYNRILDLNDASSTTLPFDAQAVRPQLLAVGDFDDGDSDGKADVAVLWPDLDPSSGGVSEVRMTIFGASPTGGDAIIRRKDFEIFSGGFSDTIDAFFGSVVMAALASANVDDDTRIVEYTGDHTVLFSDPVVMAVLASSPFHGDLAHADGHTVLGDSTTSGHSVSHAVGANLGFTLGASVESPLWGSAGSFEAKVTVAVAADFIWGGSSEVTYTSAVENPSGQDLVVFTAVPYDAYAYRIVASPDPLEIGELFSLNIPRESRVYSAERTYFNANNGDGPDIDERVLPHTVGDPDSYPNLAERNALMEGSRFVLISNATHTCGGAGALWSLGCEWSDEHSAGAAVDVSIQSEIETVSGGLLLGISGGYHFGVEVVWHWSNATFIEGAVGDMTPADFEAGRSFDWGVFSHEAVLPGNERPFTVVNYWVPD